VSAALKKLGEINPYRLAPSSAPALWANQKPTGQGQESERPIPVRFTSRSLGLSRLWRPSPELRCLHWRRFSSSSSSSSSFFCNARICAIAHQACRIERFAAHDLAMNDVAGRLSRFFLVQTLVNASFGVIIALASISSACRARSFGASSLLATVRPYIGPVIAAGFPVALAAALDPGWGIALETLALFLIVEPISGRELSLGSMAQYGISPIAVVISATFWTWLWGTVGLVLSTPLTVCLVVLGRHVERLLSSMSSSATRRLLLRLKIFINACSRGTTQKSSTKPNDS